MIDFNGFILILLYQMQILLTEYICLSIVEILSKNKGFYSGLCFEVVVITNLVL